MASLQLQWMQCQGIKKKASTINTQALLSHAAGSAGLSCTTTPCLAHLFFYRTTFRSSRKNNVFEGCGMSVG
eukprot:1156850-Pelagomonas_calceolata.AAC.7